MLKRSGSRAFCSTNRLSYDPLSARMTLFQDGLCLLESPRLGGRDQVHTDDCLSTERSGIFKLPGVVPDDLAQQMTGLLGCQDRKPFLDEGVDFLLGDARDTVFVSGRHTKDR